MDLFIVRRCLKSGVAVDMYIVLSMISQIILACDSTQNYQDTTVSADMFLPEQLPILFSPPSPLPFRIPPRTTFLSFGVCMVDAGIIGNTI